MSIYTSDVAIVAIDTRQLDNLPNLCVKTGEPTSTTRREDFADLPGWTFLLIFWGLFPFLIAAGFARHKVTVDLPASKETLRRTRLVGFGAVVGLVLGIGLLVSALVSQEGAFAWAGIAVALTTLVAAAGARGVVWVTGRLDGDILWLYRVHPAFAREAHALVPPNISQHLSAHRWAFGLLIAAIIMLGVLIFFLLQVRA